MAHSQIRAADKMEAGAGFMHFPELRMDGKVIMSHNAFVGICATLVGLQLLPTRETAIIVGFQLAARPDR